MSRVNLLFVSPFPWTDSQAGELLKAIAAVSNLREVDKVGLVASEVPDSLALERDQLYKSGIANFQFQTEKKPYMRSVNAGSTASMLFSAFRTHRWHIVVAVGDAEHEVFKLLPTSQKKVLLTIHGIHDAARERVRPFSFDSTSRNGIDTIMRSLATSSYDYVLEKELNDEVAIDFEYKDESLRIRKVKSWDHFAEIIRSMVPPAVSTRCVEKHYYNKSTNDIAQAVNLDHVNEGPMRIALDMRWMIPGEFGGVENLARSFLKELLQIDSYNSYSIMLPGSSRYDFDWRGKKNYRLHNHDSAWSTIKAKGAQYTRYLLSQLSMAGHLTDDLITLRRIYSLEADFVYSFPGYIYPDMFLLPNILVVPDIQHEFLPDVFSPQHLEERRRIYRRSVGHAVHICAISEFTRNTLIDRLDVSPDRVTAVQLAADAVFDDEHRSRLDTAQILKNFNLIPGEYIYFPAHTWAHKNHLTALEALKLVRDQFGLEPQLVLTGAKRESFGAIRERTEKLRLEHQVRFLDYIALEKVPALYVGAAALIYPSLFEGFGMPVLEAMKCGCPVICSNTSSLPEIAGNAAILIEPLDAEAIAYAIYQVLSAEEKRHEMIKRGREQAEKFSWRRHTMESLTVFRNVKQVLGHNI